jgi:hypothetical protein
MSDIIASLNAGDALAFSDAQLLESGPAISEEISLIITDGSTSREVQSNAVQLGARIISLSSPNDAHATLIKALWELTSKFGSNYEAYSAAFKEAEEKVEKAAAELAAATAAGGKKPAPSKGGAPPPPPPPSISIDDLLDMVPHKQSLDIALSTLSGLLSRSPSSFDSIPQAAVELLPKLLKHHSPRIQIRVLVCLKLLFSIKGASYSNSLLSSGAIEELLSLLRSSSKGSIKKAALQVRNNSDSPSLTYVLLLHSCFRGRKRGSQRKEGSSSLFLGVGGPLLLLD